jgi:hypothetical protein
MAQKDAAPKLNQGQKSHLDYENFITGPSKSKMGVKSNTLSDE